MFECGFCYKDTNDDFVTVFCGCCSGFQLDICDECYYIFNTHNTYQRNYFSCPACYNKKYYGSVSQNQKLHMICQLCASLTIKDETCKCVHCSFSFCKQCRGENDKCPHCDI
jgi:hypothetical protein